MTTGTAGSVDDPLWGIVLQKLCKDIEYTWAKNKLKSTLKRTLKYSTATQGFCKLSRYCLHIYNYYMYIIYVCVHTNTTQVTKLIPKEKKTCIFYVHY